MKPILFDSSVSFVDQYCVELNRISVVSLTNKPWRSRNSSALLMENIYIKN